MQKCHAGDVSSGLSGVIARQHKTAGVRSPTRTHSCVGLAGSSALADLTAEVKTV